MSNEKYDPSRSLISAPYLWDFAFAVFFILTCSSFQISGYFFFFIGVSLIVFACWFDVLYVCFILFFLKGIYKLQISTEIYGDLLLRSEEGI